MNIDVKDTNTSPTLVPTVTSRTTDQINPTNYINLATNESKRKNPGTDRSAREFARTNESHRRIVNEIFEPAVPTGRGAFSVNDRSFSCDFSTRQSRRGIDHERYSVHLSNHPASSEEQRKYTVGARSSLTEKEKQSTMIARRSISNRVGNAIRRCSPFLRPSSSSSNTKVIPQTSKLISSWKRARVIFVEAARIGTTCTRGARHGAGGGGREGC